MKIHSPEDGKIHFGQEKLRFKDARRVASLVWVLEWSLLNN
jgi:hypothetical protein